MNSIEDLRRNAASVAAYHAALTELLQRSENEGGAGYDREWHVTMLATAAAYLMFQHGGEHFSVLEAHMMRSRLYNIADEVLAMVGGGAHRKVPEGETPNYPETEPDPFD